MNCQTEEENRIAKYNTMTGNSVQLNNVEWFRQGKKNPEPHMKSWAKLS